MGDGGGPALLAERENLDVEFAAFRFNVEHVADADLASGLGGLVVRGDAVEFAGLGGLLAGLEEAGGPEPFVDAGAGHGSYFRSVAYRSSAKIGVTLKNSGVNRAGFHPYVHAFAWDLHAGIERSCTNSQLDTGLDRLFVF